MKARNSLILLVVLAVAGAVAAQQRPDPDSPRFKAAMAVRGLLEDADPDLAEFARKSVAFGGAAGPVGLAGSPLCYGHPDRHLFWTHRRRFRR